MLTDITLKNFTVVDELHLELQSGLCVISGETGAGKSILVDAIELGLGKRGDSQVIRHGSKKCEISLSFTLNPNAKAWLTEHDYSADNECLLIRTLQHDGRSRLTLNGKPIALNLAREFSSHLIRLHSQHESYNLLQRQQQERLVDLYAKNGQLLNSLKKIYTSWQTNQLELNQLVVLSQEREQQLGFLRYQLDELLALNLQADEWENLHREHQQLHNANKLIAQINKAIQFTAEDDNYSSNRFLQQAIQQLELIHPADTELTEILSLLNTAAIHLQEANDGLARYRDALDLSPERLATIEQRLGAIHDLARKHHAAVEDLEAIVKSLQGKISKLENADEQIILLQDAARLLQTQYQKIAAEITQKRIAAAQVISQQISHDMQTLGMHGGEFTVHLETQNEALNPNGNEKIEFWVKTNPGQASQPLSKVVSGGELSRLSLALQSLIATQEPVPTFVFDEVDVGIGGHTAEIVGKLLRHFAENRQVFCITHLPQVAAAGQHHYQVIKQVSRESTLTRMKLLSHKERVEEIARMISGSKISAETLKHAEQLLV